MFYLLNLSLIFYQAGAGNRLSKQEMLHNFLEGTAGSHLESFGDDEKDAGECATAGGMFVHLLLIYVLIII